VTILEFSIKGEGGEGAKRPFCKGRGEVGTFFKGKSATKREGQSRSDLPIREWGEEGDFLAGCEIGFSYSTENSRPGARLRPEIYQYLGGRGAGGRPPDSFAGVFEGIRTQK